MTPFVRAPVCTVKKSIFDKPKPKFELKEYYLFKCNRPCYSCSIYTMYLRISLQTRRIFSCILILDTLAHTYELNTHQSAKQCMDNVLSTTPGEHLNNFMLSTLKFFHCRFYFFKNVDWQSIYYIP
eukprot:NODE_520_length_6539_cov_0.561801.p2 type:complete len:126 gc:universal NODE_520_length_6539_cov_0.561801:2640-2263(-)